MIYMLLLITKTTRGLVALSISYTGRLECSLTLSSSESSCDKMTRCSSRRTVFRPLCELLATSKLCAASIAAKLVPEVLRKWEGPYRVKQVTRPGAVRLETEDATPVSNSWNVGHLRKFRP